MLNALILLVTSFSLILYYYKKKPGVILGCFLLFPIIANIIQIELGLPFEFRYILRLVVLLIFIFQTFNSRAAVFNINWLLNSKIFFGILFFCYLRKKEFISVGVSFIFGIIVIPAVLTLLLSSELKELKSFYEALFNKRHFFMPLLIVFSHIF